MLVKATKSFHEGDVHQQYEQLIASIDGIVWEADIKSFQFTFVSQPAERLLGFPLEEWYTPGFWVEHLHQDDRDWAVQFCMQATHEKRNHDFEYRMITLDGRTIWLRDLVSVIVEDGEPTKLRGIMVDVTERKLTEEALRAREADLKLTLDAGKIGEWKWNIVTGKITWSPFCKALYGLPPDAEMTYERFLAAIHPDDRQSVDAGIKRALDTGCDYEIEKRVIWPDGTVHWNTSRGRVLYDAGGQPLFVAGLTMDITDRKLAEEERQAHLWFLESMDKINRALQGTNDLEKMMGDVLDSVLSIFNCDRAWLLYPCDPEAAFWRVPMERTRPEFPGAAVLGIDLPIDANVAQAFRTVLALGKPVRFDPGSEHSLPPEAARRFNVQSQIAMAVYPKIDKPYMFGLHQCSHPRVWTPEEERLFQEIGRRLADALTSLLAYRNLRESEAKLGEAQRIAHVGYWDIDLNEDLVTCSDEAYRIFGLPVEKRAISPAHFGEQIYLEDMPKISSAAAEAIRGGPPYDVEYRLLRPNGKIRIVHSQGNVTWDESGQPRRMFGTVQDITEQRQAEEELRASEARFRTLVDHATDAFFLHDDGGTILDVNRQACESLGYPREELIGKSPYDFDVDIGRGFLDQVGARLSAGEVITFDSRHRRKDGTDFPVEVRIRPFQEGGQRYAVSLARDITDRKRTQEALALFRSLIDHSNDTVEIVDPETGRFLDLNERACLDHGYSREEYLALTVSQIDPQIALRSWEEVMEEVRQCGSRVFESQHRRKDGSIFPVEVITNYIRLDRDYVLAVVRDITERKRAEQALIEGHSLLNAVVEGTPDAVFVKDLQGRYLMINSAGARFLGKTVEEVIGKHDRELFSADTAEVVMKSDRQVLATGESHVFEETATAACMTRTYLATKGVYRGAQGQAIGLIGIARDVTELKRLEEQFQQSQKMEAVGRLAGGVAHDFNNLLTVINGYSNLVSGSLRTDDPNRALLAEIQKSGERAANLTRQLLAFSRKQVLQPQVVSIKTLLGELLRLLQRLIGEDIEITLATDPSLGLAKIDPSQFEQAIINLAVNARDAMPQGGSLTIQTASAELDEAYAESHPEVKPGQYLLVTVSDSGQGMDEATRSRVFEPFFTTKGPGKGTGLGLAMVYGFVKQSGGHVEVLSQLGHGTTFSVYLPRAEETTPSAKSSPDLLKIPKGTETVLLVEDEDSVRTLSRLVLQSSGYTVLEARHGQEAVWIAPQHQGPIHLLMTDLVMPGMSGRQLAKQLAEGRPNMRILFMSGYTDEEILRHGVSEGSVAFLQKPFSAMCMARKVREVLDA